MSGFLHGLSFGVLIVTVMLTVTAVGLWFERKFAGRMQSRLGPTLVGPAGLLQPVADVVKLLQKEDIIPRDADRWLFNLAPPLGVVAAIAAAGVIPFGNGIYAVDLNIGVLYILAAGALTVIPVFTAGWGSNNKFALLGGMRSIAQSVSYEIPMVMAAFVPIILAGSMNVRDIVAWQAQNSWVAVWPTFLGLPAFVLFMMGLLAESNRIPFDIPEAESELVAGITTEYTGIKFVLFYMAEYVHTLVGSAVAATLFLGGWDGPFLPGLPWMVAKTLLLFGLIFWIRWSLLRFRSDQLLAICWKWLVPFGILLVAATGAWVVWVG